MGGGETSSVRAGASSDRATRRKLSMRSATSSAQKSGCESRSLPPSMTTRVSAGR